MTTQPSPNEISTSFRLAIVDDDPLFLDRLATTLSYRTGSRVFPVATGDELLALLEREPVDCVVLDYELENETGLAVADRLKAKFRDSPPVVMLTGSGSERTVVKAFRGGFSDYVSKRNLDTQELLRAIHSAVEKHAEATAAGREIEQLKKKLKIDPVTALYVSEHVHALLGDAMSDPSQRSVLVLVSPREIAQVRAKIGHNAADKVLRAFANKFRLAPAGTTIWGHFDADSFAYLLQPAPKQPALESICQSLRQSLSFDVELDGMAIRLSSAIGAARFPLNGNGLEAVGDAARTAMRQSESEEKGFAIAPSASGLQSETDAPAPPTEAAGAADPDFVLRRVERRKEHRQRVLKRGKIIVQGMSTVIDCTIRNLSRSGAFIRVDSFFVAPDQFTLTIVGSGGPRAVNLRWQTGNDIGVEFEEPME